MNVWRTLWQIVVVVMGLTQLISGISTLGLLFTTDQESKVAAVPQIVTIFCPMTEPWNVCFNPK